MKNGRYVFWTDSGGGIHCLLPLNHIPGELRRVYYYHFGTPNVVAGKPVIRSSRTYRERVIAVRPTSRKASSQPAPGCYKTKQKGCK
jgi:hypothetical protein